MELFTTILVIIQAMSISLGVGVSTMAIVNFFYAIADGTIDPIERGFMGVTYIVLRIAMVLIILTVAGLAILGLFDLGSSYVTGYVLAQLFLTALLFINASLMTARIMPSTFGPAIQASSWYSLGFILTLIPLGMSDFLFMEFLFCFILFVILMIIIINAIMRRQRNKSA